MDQLTDRADHVKRLLVDPVAFCAKLGWLDGHKRQARGVLIRCPSHGEKHPSCSVTVASDGLLRVKCFACDFAGDALTMVAFAHTLSARTDFREVLAIGAELGGDHWLAGELRGQSQANITRPAPRPVPAPVLELDPPTYPSKQEVARLWADCVAVDNDGEAVRMMMGRGLGFEALTQIDVCRVMPVGYQAPSWASYRGEALRARPWSATGHRLLLPVFDHTGEMRSVRAWRLVDGDTPKRLPPAGKKSAELVLANQLATSMLDLSVCPLRLMIVEGEPDFLTTTIRYQDCAVIGVGSGWWTDDFARRVPRRTEVIVATHADRAGDKYAETIVESMKRVETVWRWRMVA